MKAIIDKYLGYSDAVVLEKLGFSKYVSRHIPLLRYDKSKCLVGFKEGPLDEGHIYCPSLSLVQSFLREVYRVHIAVHPMFGEKKGYDSWEVVGYRFFIGEENEYGLCYLNNDDLDEWIKSYKFCNHDSFHEEFWDQVWVDINKDYDLCFQEAIKCALEMLGNSDAWHTWRDLRRKRLEEAVVDPDPELPKYVWFQSGVGYEVWGLMELGDDGTYRTYCTDVESPESLRLEFKFGEWIVMEASHNSFLGCRPIVVKNEKDRDIIADIIRRNA